VLIIPNYTSTNISAGVDRVSCGGRLAVGLTICNYWETSKPAIRFRGNGRKRRTFPRRDVFVILDVIISFRDGERADPEEWRLRNYADSKPHWSLESGVSHSVVELAKFNDNTEDKVCLPSPRSQQSCCTAHSYPSLFPAPLVLHTSGSRNAGTPKMSGARRMNTLPFPSATELTCTPCPTLPRKCLDERVKP
jgi:hypothetical protein